MHKILALLMVFCLTITINNTFVLGNEVFTGEEVKEGEGILINSDFSQGLSYWSVSDTDEVLSIQQEIIEVEAEENSIINLNSTSTRTYDVPGKGSAWTNRDNQRRKYAFNPYEPTGIYVSPNEELEIYVSGEGEIYAAIENHVVRGFRTPVKIPLTNGLNTISASNDGLLYFINENQEGSINIDVLSGGTTVPLFILGEHDINDWAYMLDEYQGANYVELKGDRVLITLTRETAEKYLKGKDPSILLLQHDEAVRIQDRVTGVDYSFLGVNQASKHYMAFVEDQTANWFYAGNALTGFNPRAAGEVINPDNFTSNGWGPWHEQGHQRQQLLWEWSGLSEVTVNIYSLSVQRAFGNASRLETQNVYPGVFTHLAQPNDSKQFDSLDVWAKLAMFWRLDLAFGEDFYPLLHQIYREMPASQLPSTDEEKRQTFIHVSSVIANRNLVPFYEQWDLSVSDETKIKIENLPELENQIWLNRDTSYIIENTILNTEDYKAQVQQIINFNESVIDIRVVNNSGQFNVEVEIDKAFQEGSNRIVVESNGEILGESYEGIGYFARVEEGTNTNILIIENVNLSYQDDIKFILSSGKPGDAINVLTQFSTKVNEAAFKPAIKDIRIGKSDNTVIDIIEVEIDKRYQEGNNRIIVEVNGVQIGESYQGIGYYARVEEGTDTNVLIIEDLNLSENDEISVILSSGVPGDVVNNIIDISLNVKNALFKYEIKDIRVVNNNKNIEVEVGKEYQEGSNRIVIDINGKYRAESYAGSTPYASVRKGNNTNIINIQNLQLVPGDEIKVSLSTGSPGQSRNTIEYIIVIV